MLSLVIFSSVLADNVTSQSSTDVTKQQLIQLLTKLIAELETRLQTLLKNLTQSPSKNTSTSTQSTLATTSTQTSNSSATSSAFSLKMPTTKELSMNQLESLFSKSVKVYTTTPYQAKPGQKIKVEGMGFDSVSNNFSFGGSIQNVGCLSSTICEVIVPTSTPLGKQSVSLSNNLGSSASQGFTVGIQITNSPINPSVITNIVPNTITDDSTNIEIVVSGTGFESNGNYIYTPFGKTGPFNSDGKKISFNLKSITELGALFKKIKTFNAGKLPLPIRVYNDYGMSEVGYIYINLKK